MFHKEGSQQLDIPSECSIVRKACFPKVLQGFWVHRVGGFFFGQAILAGILCFTNGFAVFLGRVFFGQGKSGNHHNPKIFPCYMHVLHIRRPCRVWYVYSMGACCTRACVRWGPWCTPRTPCPTLPGARGHATRPGASAGGGGGGLTTRTGGARAAALARTRAGQERRKY